MATNVDKVINYEMRIDLQQIFQRFTITYERIITQLTMRRRPDVGKRRQLVGHVGHRPPVVGPTSARCRPANGWATVGRTASGRRPARCRPPTVGLTMSGRCRPDYRMPSVGLCWRTDNGPTYECRCIANHVYRVLQFDRLFV